MRITTDMILDYWILAHGHAALLFGLFVVLVN